MQFYELLQAALEGHYDTVDIKFFSETEDSRLRGIVQNLNTSFSNHMREFGQRRKVKADTGSDRAETAPQRAAPKSAAPKSVAPESETTAGYEPASEGQILVSEAEMIQWVKKVRKNPTLSEILCLTYVQIYIRSRGKELPGNYNAALLAELFREQSIQWPDIAESHIQRILKTATQWIQLAVEHLIGEHSLRDHIYAILKEWLDNTELNALEELRKLIEDEQRAPLTYNHYYTDNVQKDRADILKKIKTEICDHGTAYTDGTVKVDLKQIIPAIQAHITVDMDEQACNNAITELRSYYKVIMVSFFLLGHT
jgi:hypothetical protein